MVRNISLWQIANFAFTGLLGTLFHFLYELTGNNKIAALISSVNESTWEHMKLLFFPLFLFALIERMFFPKANDFWCIKVRGILLGITLIPVIFYTYNGAFGKSPDWLNITIFFTAAAVSLIYETHLFKKENIKCKNEKGAFILLCATAILFFLFTFFPLPLPLFTDPYGGRGV